MAADHAKLAEMLSEGWAMAPRGWRRLWPIQLLAAVGLAVMVAGLRADLSALAVVGAALAVAAWAPLWTGVCDLALGRGVGGGGVRFGRAEVRLIGLAVVGLAALAACFLALVAASAVLLVALHGAGEVSLGKAGAVEVSLLAVAAAWIAGLCGLAYAAARLALLPMAAVTDDLSTVERLWGLTRGRALAILGVLTLAQGPGLLALSLIGLGDSLAGHTPFAAHQALPAALAAGAVLGLVTAFIQAPLSAGVLAAHRRVARRNQLPATPVAIRALPSTPTSR